MTLSNNKVKMNSANSVLLMPDVCQAMFKVNDNAFKFTFATSGNAFALDFWQYFTGGLTASHFEVKNNATVCDMASSLAYCGAIRMGVFSSLTKFTIQNNTITSPSGLSLGNVALFARSGSVSALDLVIDGNTVDVSCNFMNSIIVQSQHAITISNNKIATSANCVFQLEIWALPSSGSTFFFADNVITFNVNADDALGVAPLVFWVEKGHDSPM